MALRLGWLGRLKSRYGRDWLPASHEGLSSSRWQITANPCWFISDINEALSFSLPVWRINKFLRANFDPERVHMYEPIPGLHIECCWGGFCLHRNRLPGSPTFPQIRTFLLFRIFYKPMQMPIQCTSRHVNLGLGTILCFHDGCCKSSRNVVILIMIHVESGCGWVGSIIGRDCREQIGF